MAKLFNLLKRSDILIVAEGLDVFRVPVPSSLACHTIAESAIRQNTGCSIIAINYNNTMEINPDTTIPIRENPKSFSSEAWMPKASF